MHDCVPGFQSGWVNLPRVRSRPPLEYLREDVKSVLMEMTAMPLCVRTTGFSSQEVQVASRRDAMLLAHLLVYRSVRELTDVVAWNPLPVSELDFKSRIFAWKTSVGTYSGFMLTGMMLSIFMTCRRRFVSVDG